MATKKKKTTKKINKRPKISKAEQKRQEKKRKVITTVSLILLYIFTTVLLFLSFYSGLLGESGTGIRDFFRGVFGSASYVFPFAMIFGFFYYFTKKKQGGGYGVEHKRVARCKKTADFARQTACRTVAFHADNRIAEINTRFLLMEHRGQIDEHPIEVVVIGITCVKFKFGQTRNTAEGVFDRAAHTGQGMTFQLAEIDDDVGIRNRRDDVKAFADLTVWSRYGTRGDIEIQSGIVPLHRFFDAADCVYAAQSTLGVRTAHAFCDDNIGTVTAVEIGKQSIENGRMRRRRIFCRLFHDEIGLDCDFFPREKRRRYTKLLHHGGNALR